MQDLWESNLCLDEYDSLFSFAMNELIAKGLDFKALVRQTLNEILGEIPFETLFIILGEERSRRPTLFVEAMHGYLGKSAPTVCNLIATRGAEMVPAGRLIPEVAAFEAVKRRFESSEVSESKRRKEALLHDHRIPDELEEYRDRLA